MEKLFYALKDLEKKIPSAQLSYIMQNPHHITEEELDEWKYNFQQFMALLKFDYEKTVEQAENIHLLIEEYYEHQDLSFQ